MKYTTIQVLIPSGGSTATVEQELEEGMNVKVALLTNDVPSSSVDVKIEDSNRSDIHPSVNYKEYQPTNGNHMDSRKDLVFKAGNKIKIIANVSGALTADFNFQMLFYIQD